MRSNRLPGGRGGCAATVSPVVEEVAQQPSRDPGGGQSGAAAAWATATHQRPARSSSSLSLTVAGTAGCTRARRRRTARGTSPPAVARGADRATLGDAVRRRSGGCVHAGRAAASSTRSPAHDRVTGGANSQARTSLRPLPSTGSRTRARRRRARRAIRPVAVDLASSLASASPSRASVTASGPAAGRRTVAAAQPDDRTCRSRPGRSTCTGLAPGVSGVVVSSSSTRTRARPRRRRSRGRRARPHARTPARGHDRPAVRPSDAMAVLHRVAFWRTVCSSDSLREGHQDLPRPGTRRARPGVGRHREGRVRLPRRRRRAPASRRSCGSCCASTARPPAGSTSRARRSTGWPAGRCRGCAARSAPSSRTSACCTTRPSPRTSRSRCR